MTQIVETVLVEAAKQKKVESIDEITLELGELTLISGDQLRFAFDVMIKRYDTLKNARLSIEKKFSVGRCRCGYRGHIPIEYRGIIDLSCPDCGKGRLELVEGNECRIKNIRMTVGE